MNQSAKRILSLLVAATFLIIACGLGQPENNPEEVTNLVVTSVAETLTAIPTSTPAPTDTPSPTPTEVVPTIQFTAMPTFVLPTNTPMGNAKTDYVCNVTDQKPFDDTEFRPGDSFDIKWTIVNTGAKKWEDKTYLEYQDGPEMTDKTQIELPNLKPGGKYDVILDATAPSEAGMQVMVWAVVGPGTIKDSVYWMCYPYIRIIVK
ncbi:hypothetical protein ANAEL_00253 [Anaerolineales bacterium]|nr:hypothetical protein ANAEL_00253 [Anaerolineales bacterium]